MIVSTKQDIEFMLNYFTSEGIKEINFDTETSGLFDFVSELNVIQLGSVDKQFIIKFKDLDKDSILLLEEKIFNNKDILKIGHNLSFDIKFLWLYGISICNVYDTMIAELLLHAGYEVGRSYFSLDKLLQRYLSITISKEMQSKIHLDEHLWSKEGIEYMYNDVRYNKLIKDKQVEIITKLGMKNVLALEHKCLLANASIEYNGISLDTEALGEIDTLISDELDSIKKVINVLASEVDESFDSETMNWNSWVQKQRILRCIDPSLESTDVRSLTKRKNMHPIFKYLIKYNKLNKVKSNFTYKLVSYLNPVTNRLHSNIWPIVSTGRMSFSKPALQQIPSDKVIGTKIRSCFIAKEGYSIVGADYGQIELRIVAEFSKDPLWVNAFKQGQDLHNVLCSETFNIPIENVKDKCPFKPEKTYRDIQKTVNFGLIYSMGAHKLADTLEISLAKAEEIIDNFFSKVGPVQDFLEKVRERGFKRGYIKTAKPFSRYRFFTSSPKMKPYQKSNIMRKAGNHPIQGTCADIIKLALVYIYEYILEHDYPAKLILTCHDEILTECVNSRAKEWRDIMERLMLKAASAVLKEVPVTCDAHIGKSWNDVH